MAQIPPVPPAGGASPVHPEVPPAAAPPAAVPPAEPPAALVAPPVVEEPSTLTMTSKQLDERLERARATERSRWLNEHGFESEEAFSAFKKASDEQEAAAAEAQRQELSEIERYKADLAAQKAATEAANAATTAAQKEATDARREAHLRALFAQRGIANADYAFHLVEKACGELEEGQELNEVTFLDDLVANETQKAALGMVAPPPAEGLANTTPPVTSPPPAPATSGAFDAMTATAADWAARKKELGIS